ncbi:MAG TPA: carbonic anhydrase [Planctomycetota bacterium]|jgi:carbonic anhydrase|nr:carbonic anhydrase [Planctomycetota bacterium]
MHSGSLLLVPVLFFGLCQAEEHHAEAKPAAGSHDAAADHASGGEPVAQGLDAHGALDRLMQGNQRFVNDLMSKAHKDSDRRSEVAKSQHPIAIVVCCSDSRVGPEQLFDVGLGDIFVIRVAGNVVDALELGSIEYAAAHLHVPLVVVVGHERCGAVTAAVSGDPAPAHVLAIVEKIQANLAGTAPVAGDAVDQAVRINAKAVAHQIASCGPLLKDMVTAGTLSVVAGRYDLDDGIVTILP